jgi:hypothetical protein
MWRQKAEMALKWERIFIVVDGTKPKPSPLPTSKHEIQELQEEDKAMSIIGITLSANILIDTINQKTRKARWDYLVQKYKKSSEVM